MPAMFGRLGRDADTVGLVSPKPTKTNPLGAGRNPRAGEAAEHRVTIRVTDAEHAAYQRAAAAVKLTVAEWVRACCAAGLTGGKRRRA